MPKRRSRKRSPPSTPQQKIEQAHGQVIQAGGNVIIHSSDGKTEEKSGLVKKLVLWLGIVGTAATIITTVLGWPKACQEYVCSPGARFWGQVVDENGLGVASASIIVLAAASGDTIGKGTSDGRGDFNFIVSAKTEEAARVRVFKNGLLGFDEFKVIGPNVRLPFKGAP